MRLVFLLLILPACAAAPTDAARGLPRDVRNSSKDSAMGSGSALVMAAMSSIMDAWIEKREAPGAHLARRAVQRARLCFF